VEGWDTGEFAADRTRDEPSGDTAEERYLLGRKRRLLGC